VKKYVVFLSLFNGFVQFLTTGTTEQKPTPQGEKKQKTLVFTKKENATLKQCIEILDWHHKNAERIEQRQLFIGTVFIPSFT